MPSVGFKGQAPDKGGDQTLMMALRKDSAQRPAPDKAPAPAAAKRATNQPSLMQALEMTGRSPDTPDTPGDPQPGGSATAQSAELGGEITVTDLLRRVTADLPEVDEEEGKQPNIASEERRQPRIEAELAAQRDMVLAIVARAAQALSINPDDVDVQVDPEGGPAADAGTRGLQQGSSIFLDGGSFDPGSMDGAQLITHEVIHQAQRGLPGMGDDPIGMAEAEATLLAERFVRGGGMLPVQAGLPDGHAAAENGGGTDVSALIAQYRATIDANAQTVAPIPESPSGGGGSASQDHASKVRQYTDGVDGIADQIGGLDAFDELCDQLGTFGDGETAGPLASIKSSGPYRELCRMWQGAKEGGEDAAAMKRAFDNEFDGRGFWGSTEEAFDLVQAAAKRDARPEAEAESARGEADAAGEAVTNAETALAEAGASGPAGGPAGGAATGPAVDPRMAALMGASVDAAAPELGAFAELSGVSDDQIEAIMGQSRHFDSFSDRAAGGEFQSRASQVFETLGENALGGALQSGTDTLLDGLVFDQVGFFADQGLKLVTRGRLNTPMVGPLIGLVQSPPWEASSWGADQATAAMDSFGQMGETWAAFDQAQEPMDYVGIFCALLADLFEGLRDLLDAIATFCGTLSAVCYVVGGLLILFGIALLWLAGVGAPLITAGGWMTRAGSILGRINSALGPIVLALSAIGLFFRTLSALMVPADLYANQLAGVGSAAGTFGEKAGARVADEAVGQVNQRLQDPIADRVNGRVQDGAGGDDNGGNANADDVVRDLDEVDAAIQQDLADDAPDADLDRPVDGDDDPERPRDDDAEPDTTTPRGRFRAFVGRIGARLRATNLGTAIADLRQLGSDPRRAAMEGLSPQLRADFEQKLDSRLREKTATFESMRQELADAGTDIDPADKARLEADIRDAGAELDRLKTQLDDTRVAITEAEAAEALARRDREAEEDDDDDTRTRAEEAEHLRQEKARLTEEGARLQAELDRVNDQLDTRRPAVQERVQAIQAEIERLRTERQTAQEGVDAAEADARRAAGERQTELQAEVDRLLGEMSDAQDQAARLEAQADAVEQAATLRTEADAAARQAETAQAQADALRGTLQGRVGQRIQLTDPEGRNANGLISRKVVGFTDTGIIIAEGRDGAQRTVPFADVARPLGFRDAAQSYGEATAQASAAQQTAQSTRAQADGLDATGADPAALRAQAQQHRDGALGLLGDHEAAERAAQGDTTPQAERDRVRDARAAAGELDTALASSQQEIDRLNGEVTQLANSEADLAGQVRENTAAIATADEGIRTAEAEAEQAASGNSHYGLTARGSSGNATGGIGSSNAVWGEWLMQKSGAVDALIRLAESTGADVSALRAAQADPTQDDPSTGAAASAAMMGGLGIEVETEDQLRAIGTRRANIENLLQDGPPSDPAELTARRQAALEAYEQYQLAHARAYRAFVAEQIVEEHATETANMAASGAPIVERSQSMTEPLNTAASTEADRTSQLNTGGGDVTASSEPAGGIVGELITRLADSGDALDDQPTPPDPDAGNQVDSGQELAASENTERTAQGADASTQQRAFIDAAIQARAQQEEQVSTDITALEDKHAAELAIKEEIQRAKAQALMERDTHGQTAEREAQAFNAEFQALDGWRTRYARAAAELSSE